MKPVWLVLFVASCASSVDSGSSEDLDEAEGLVDSLRKPTEHGAIGFGVPEHSALTDDERHHAWTFQLVADARVDLATSYSVRGQRRTDTVLYLYRLQPNGSWGPYIARNDDHGDTTYSQLVRDLGEGVYRATVKGHSDTTRGKFKLTVSCEGDGCAPPQNTTCVFGDSYNDIPNQPALQVLGRTKITFATLPNLDATRRDRIVRAVQQSSHDDVRTAEEALARVDQQEINLSLIIEPAAHRRYEAYEYGAGDNSYGAIFEKDTNAMVTNIHDGDLEHCETPPQICLLPEDWSVLRDDPAFTRTRSRVVTSAASLSSLEAAQALGAFRRSYDDVTSAEDGLARVDRNEVNFVDFTHVATGEQITVVEYGAGDTSVGAIYRAGTPDLAGAIDDLSIVACTLFAE
jgi:hypothetical protein